MGVAPQKLPPPAPTYVGRGEATFWVCDYCGARSPEPRERCSTCGAALRAQNEERQAR
jgi:ribosomal protein L40E